MKCAVRGGSEEAGILVAELAALGFESFSEEDDALLAYIPQEDFSRQRLLTVEALKKLDEQSALEVRLIEDQNWNAVWESNYPPVTIGNCHVRAPFHPENPSVRYDIVLDPKMAFGTAHHETTVLMIELLLSELCEGKRVLDMGCGTAVLAILASMKGAKEVTAIDNDDWANRNALENVALNHCTGIVVKQGDATALKSLPAFDLILANINKNILLQDMAAYAEVLKKRGRVFFSGFYTEDLEAIGREAGKHGLKFVTSKTKNNWVAAVFSR